MLVSVDVSSASLSGVYETFLSTEEDERDERRTEGAERWWKPPSCRTRTWGI